MAEPLDRQEADGFERLEVGADAPIGEAEIHTEPLLPGVAEILLPRVAEQHGEGHLVAGAELRRSEDEIGNLGEALRGGGVGVLEDDVALFEYVADVSALGVFHVPIIARAQALLRVIPCPGAAVIVIR